MKYFTQEEQEILEFLVREEIFNGYYDAIIKENTLKNILMKIHCLDKYLEMIKNSKND